MIPTSLIIRLLPLLIIPALGCGGDDDGPTGPTAVEGPYLMTFGSQPRVFALGPGEAQVVCRPKPGLGEFEMTATMLGSDGGSSFTFNLKEYSSTKKSYDVEYGVGKPLHQVDVTLSGGYKYKFFYSFRTDNNEAFNSRCNIEMDSEELATTTRYAMDMYCVMIWADTTSKDFSSNILNNYIDMAAKFECEY